MHHGGDGISFSLFCFERMTSGSPASVPGLRRTPWQSRLKRVSFFDNVAGVGGVSHVRHRDGDHDGVVPGQRWGRVGQRQEICRGEMGCYLADVFHTVR